MKIVVEGCDASGKSTLAKALAEKHGLSLVEAGPKPVSDFVAISDSIAQASMEDVVHARITPISRQVYQFDSPPSHLAQLQEILQVFIQKGTTFIFCVGRADTHVIKSYDTPEHLQFLKDNEQRIRDNYEKIFATIPHTRYDFNEYRYVWRQYDRKDKL